MCTPTLSYLRLVRWPPLSLNKRTICKQLFRFNTILSKSPFYYISSSFFSFFFARIELDIHTPRSVCVCVVMQQAFLQWENGGGTGDEINLENGTHRHTHTLMWVGVCLQKRILDFPLMNIFRYIRKWNTINALFGTCDIFRPYTHIYSHQVIVRLYGGGGSISGGGGCGGFGFFLLHFFFRNRCICVCHRGRVVCVCVCVRLGCCDKRGVDFHRAMHNILVHAHTESGWSRRQQENRKAYIHFHARTCTMYTNEHVTHSNRFVYPKEKKNAHTFFVVVKLRIFNESILTNFCFFVSRFFIIRCYSYPLTGGWDWWGHSF